VSDLRIGVAGATGAVGKEVLTVLSGVSWRPRQVHAYAARSTATSHVEYGDQRLPVEVLDDEDLSELDVLVVATPRGTAAKAARQAVDDGVLVIDLAGVFEDDPDVPVVVPWINPERLAAHEGGGAYAIPGPAAALLAAVVGPLHRVNLVESIDATVLLPASAWGRTGMDELSRQVVALFNAGTPPRKVFDGGLAFDLLPAVGALADDGWTDAERRTSREVQALLGAELPLAATLVGVPVFSGVSAEISVRAGKNVLLELVARVLADGGVRLPERAGAKSLPRPRRVEGQPFVAAGRLRADPVDPTRVHLWASMDNLRGTAASVAALIAALLRPAP
jgi:aspartate-semialdehyde dehydrogenase